MDESRGKLALPVPVTAEIIIDTAWIDGARMVFTTANLDDGHWSRLSVMETRHIGRKKDYSPQILSR